MDYIEHHYPNHSYNKYDYDYDYEVSLLGYRYM